ncbi:MAG: hypothetical protein ACYDAE_18375 [Steroidobacteraceae bacterium]
MSGFGNERDRVRKVPAGGLYRREGPQNYQRDEEPTLTGIMGMAMRTMGMRAVPMAMRVVVVVVVVVTQMRAVARVVVIAVMLVRMRHELGNP